MDKLKALRAKKNKEEPVTAADRLKSLKNPSPSTEAAEQPPIAEAENAVTALAPAEVTEQSDACPETTPITAEPEDAANATAAEQSCADPPMSLLFFASHGNSTMLSLTDRVRQVLIGRKVPFEEVDLCDPMTGMGVRAARERMEALSSVKETPQLFLRGKFIGAGTAAYEELVYLLDTDVDLNTVSLGDGLLADGGGAAEPEDAASEVAVEDATNEVAAEDVANMTAAEPEDAANTIAAEDTANMTAAEPEDAANTTAIVVQLQEVQKQRDEAIAEVADLKTAMQAQAQEFEHELQAIKKSHRSRWLVWQILCCIHATSEMPCGRFVTKTDVFIHQARLEGAVAITTAGTMNVYSLDRVLQIISGVGVATATIRAHFRGNATSLLKHWAFVTTVTKHLRDGRAEVEKEKQFLANEKAQAEQELHDKLHQLAVCVDAFEDDLVSFSEVTVSAEAELRLLTGCDIKIGHSLVKKHAPDEPVPEGVDAITLFQMQGALTAATGALCNLQMDLENIGSEASSDAGDLDSQDLSGLEVSEQTAGRENAEEEDVEFLLDNQDMLRFLQQEIDARKVAQIELRKAKLNQGISLLQRSAVVGNFTQTVLAETFTFWKDWVPLSRQQQKGLMSGYTMIRSVFEGWKVPEVKYIFERWVHHTSALCQTRIVNTLGKEYRLLRTRTSWRERQLIHCQTQLAAVVAERDAIADYKIERVANAIREQPGCENAADMLGNNEIAVSSAGANASAMGAEAIARANVGKVWPDADRCAIAEKNIEDTLASWESDKELRAMLIRWKEELDLPASSEELTMQEVHKGIKAMLKGNDWEWSAEDCKSYNSFWKIDGATKQSLPGDLRAWRRNLVEPGRWEYVLPPTIVGKADCADDDLGDVSGVFATNMRLKAALVALNNQHEMTLEQVKVRNLANLAAKLKEAIEGEHQAIQAEEFKELFGEFEHFTVEAEEKIFKDALYIFRKDVQSGIQLFAKQQMTSGLLRWRQHVIVNLFRRQQAAKFDKAGVFGAPSYSPQANLAMNKRRNNGLMKTLKDAEDFWVGGGKAPNNGEARAGGVPSGPEKRRSDEKRRSKPGSREGSDVRRKTNKVTDILE